MFEPNLSYALHPYNHFSDEITYEIMRIVIGLQVLFTGIALPKLVRCTTRAMELLFESANWCG